MTDAAKHRHKSRIGNWYDRWLMALARVATRNGSKARKRHVMLLKSGRGFRLFHIRKSKQKEIKSGDGGDGGRTDDLTVVKRTLRRAWLSKLPVVLRLDNDQVLARTLTLPTGVKDVMEPVLRNQLQRIAPWPAQDTLFGYSVLAAADGAKQTSVRVVAAHRPAIEALKKAITTSGMRLLAIDHTSDAGETTTLYDRTWDERAATARRLGRLLGLTLLIALCVCAAGFYEYAMKRQLLGKLDGALATVQSRLSDRQGQQERSLDEDNQQRLVLNRKMNEPPSINFLAELSKTLPDSTWVESLTLNKREFIIVGYSQDAASLISLIEKSEHFRHAKFNAPTQNIGDDGSEQFSISATVLGATGGDARQ
ncbi:MAG: PilN domain-containing protein [Hyphomicrobiaceae bacterium]